MEITGQDLRFLGELGLLAAGRNLGREAELIAAGFAAVRPRSAVPGIIRGVAALSRSDEEAAIRALRDDALKAEPESAEARALLGLALERAGYGSAADAVLTPLAGSGDDAAAAPAGMARAVLDARRGQPG